MSRWAQETEEASKREFIVTAYNSMSILHSRKRASCGGSLMSLTGRKVLNIMEAENLRDLDNGLGQLVDCNL